MCPAKHLARAHLQAIDVPFDRSLTPWQRHGRLDGGSLLAEPFGKAREWREGARDGESATGDGAVTPSNWRPLAPFRRRRWPGCWRRSTEPDHVFGLTHAWVSCVQREGAQRRAAGRCASSKVSSYPRLVGARHVLTADSATGAFRHSGRHPYRRGTAGSPPRSPALEAEGT
jgi:hypothetical protein